MAALGVRVALDPVLGAHSPYLPFLLAIIFAANVGGRGPGYAATALSMAAVTWYLLAPRHSPMVSDPHAVAGLALFVVVGWLVALLVGNLQVALFSATRAQQDLRIQARLIDLSHDAIITMDPGRRITAWNRGAEEMYGWPESAALGATTHDLLQTPASRSPKSKTFCTARDSGKGN